MERKMVRRIFVLTDQIVTLSALEVVPNSVYICGEPAKWLTGQVTVGDVLVRNEELARRRMVNPGHPEEDEFMVYRTIHEAIRGQHVAARSYAHLEMPKIAESLTMLTDFWKILGSRLEGTARTSLVDEYLRGLACEQADGWRHCRNVHKAVAQSRWSEVSERVQSPHDIRAPALLRQIEEALARRKQEIQEIQDAMDVRLEKLIEYRASLYAEVERLGTAVRKTLFDQSLFAALRAAQAIVSTDLVPPPAVVTKIALMEEHAQRLEQATSPRPFSWHAKHAAKDLTEAAACLRTGAADRAQRALERIYRANFLVLTRRRMEEVLLLVSHAHHLEVNLPAPVFAGIEGFVKELRETFSDTTLEQGFENPVLASVRTALDQTLAVVAATHDSERAKLAAVRDALVAACKPI